jgi:tetratricopeptide (TPR) repeat protein
MMKNGFRRLRVTVLIGLWMVLGGWGRSTAQSPLWVEDVMEWTINGQFARAEHFLQEQIAATDSALAPCFYLSSVLNSKMTDHESYADAPQFVRLLHFIIGQSSQQLKASPADSLRARLYFYRGSAYGYLAYYQGQTGQWFKALKNGLKAVDNLKKAVALDSTLYEAYLGLGTYKYWRSTKLKFALWLPFVPDTRKEGISDIKRAVRSPSNSRYMAMHQLIYILTDYGKYDEALAYAQEALKAFPNSVFMQWAYAHTYFKAHRYPQALAAYEHLLELIEAQPQVNASHWLACQVRIAEILRRLGRKQQAHQRSAKVLQRKDTFPNTALNQKRLERAQEIFDQTASR